MSFGGKVGEAWVEVHARGNKNSEEIRRIAKRDAEAYKDGFKFNELVDKETEARIRRIRQEMAKAFDERDFSRLVKIWGDQEKAMRGTEDALRLWTQRKEMDGKSTERYIRVLGEMRDSYLENEEAARRMKEEAAALDSDPLIRFRKEHDRLIEARSRMDDRTLAQILIGDDDPDAIRRHYGSAEQAIDRLSQRLVRLGRSNQISVEEFDRHGRALRAWGEENVAAESAAAKFAEQMKRGTELAREQEDQLRKSADSERQYARELRRGEQMAIDYERAMGRFAGRLREIEQQRAQIRRDAADRGIADILWGDDANDVTRRVRQTGASFADLNRRLEELRDQGQITEVEFDRSMRGIARATRRHIGQTDADLGGLSRSVRRWGNEYDVFTRRWRDGTSRAFGRGSRNNFLNFTGALSGLAIQIASFPIKALLSIGSAFADIAGRFGALKATGIGSFGATLGAIAPLALPAAAGLLGLAVAMGAVAFIAPAVISGITLLAGALTILVGTLVVGLLGSLLPLLPLLGALAVGLGGAALVAKAFANNSDQAKAALSGFTEGFNELARRAEPIMEDVLRSVVRLEDEFMELGGVALRAADEMAKGFDRFVDNIERPEMQQFLDQWGESIPKIVGSLSNAIADFAAGLVAWLAPVLPYAERLADAIERGADRFLEWALSSEGQNTVASWMDTAWEAAGNLWSVLGNVSGVLMSIFTSATREEGNNFLGWLEEVTEEWLKFLNSEDGQAKMAAFWEEVKEFAIEVKDLFLQVIETWDALDTKTSRENFKTILETAGYILEKIEEWGPAIETFGSIMAGVATAMLIALQPVITTLDTMVSLMERLGIIEDPMVEQVRKMGEIMGSELNYGVNLGMNATPLEFTEAQQIEAAELYNRAQALGKNVANSLNTGILIGLDKSPAQLGYEEAINPFSRGLPNVLLSAEAAGTAMANYVREGLRSGVITIPSEVGPDVSRAMTDVQRWMLESAEIDPEAFVRATKAAEGLAAWTNMLVDDFTAGGTKGADSFGSAFVRGQGGWTNRMALVGLGLAAGVTGAFDTEMGGAAAKAGDAVNRIAASISDQATAMKGAASLAFGGVSSSADEQAVMAASNMANGLIGIAQDVQGHQASMEAAALAAFSGVARMMDVSLGTLAATAATRMGEGVTALASGLQGWVAVTQSETSRFGPIADQGLSAMVGNVAARMGEGVANIATGAASMVSSMSSQMSTLPGKVTPSLDSTVGVLSSRMATGVATMTSSAQNMVNQTANTLGTLPNRASASTALLSVQLGFQMARASAAAARGASNIVSSGSNISGMVGAAASAISGLAGAIGAQMSRAFSTASYWAGRIRSVMSSASSMASSVQGMVPRTASGGIFVGAQTRVIGEAGPEAVVPLSRNLSQVDPSVRALSALAQGLTPRSESGGVTIAEGAIQVTTNTSDPELVAAAVLDRLFVEIV